MSLAVVCSAADEYIDTAREGADMSSGILTLAKHVGLVISKHCSNKSTRCGLHPALATLHLVVAVEIRMRRCRAMACAPEGRAFVG